MLYARLTLKGFVIDPGTGGMQTYNTFEEAMPHMERNEQLIPIKNEEQVGEYNSGALRPPPFNRSGLRDRR